MRIVFFGTSNVALPILEALSKKYSIAAVITMPDAKVGRKQETRESPVSVLANEMKLKLIKPEKAKNNAELLQELKKIDADLFVVVSYGKILPEEIISLPKYKTVNVHFSLLPKYRGPSPIQTALINGDNETGTTIFILDEKIDHGPILATEKMAIDDDDNFFTLSQKLAYKSASLIINTIDDYVSGKITPQPQVEISASKSGIITKQDGKIDWDQTAKQIYDRFRALYPWPGIWAKWRNKVIKITDCIPAESSLALEATAEAGTVLDGGIVICGQRTFLQIKTLQLEGKSETGILDFLNGYRELVGSKLE